MSAGMIKTACCHLLIPLAILNIVGCSTLPPTAKTAKTPNLTEKLKTTQSRVALSATQVKASQICRQMALQAAQNAFAAEKEHQEKLIQALDKGSIADIQLCADEADHASARLREAVQLSAKVVQFSAAARTAHEAAERKLQAAMRAELKADALKALKQADQESKTAIDLVEMARGLSDKLKKIWLIREPLPGTGQKPPAIKIPATQPEVSAP
jgi:hypothetical protein